MRILSVRALRGPNLWSRNPVLEALVDLESLKDTSSEMIPGFTDRLMGWLPGLIEHRCSEGVRGGFLQRLQRGTYMAHILEHVTLELQTQAGTDVGFGRARETSVEGVYKVAIRYHEEELGLASLATAHRLVLAAVENTPLEIQQELKVLRELADRTCLGPSTAAIVDAAKARMIPVQRLNFGSLVQLGYGKRLRRIWTAETDQTGAIAESIASDKELTKSFLRSAGVPVPEGRQVSDRDDAWAAAEELEGSVVVKPLDANHGRGVFMDLVDRDLIQSAYDVAANEGSGVLVEKYILGQEHRLLVVGGQLVAAARGELIFVTGDGQQTIEQLIQTQVNSDPRRGDDESCPLNPVLLDALTLAELQLQGLNPTDIPPGGKRVLVRRNDNLSEDVTDLVHPSIAEHAVVAARVVGLDIAGIDLVVQDIAQPLEPQQGAIVEVNAGPGLLPHLRPHSGRPRPVGEAIINSIFPPGDNGRIPLVSITGTNGKTTVTRLVAAMLAQQGHSVGMACTDGVFVNSRVIDRGDCAGPRSARKVLMNPIVDAAVLECARGGILREGLGFDRCDVAIVTNLAQGDHLGEYDLHTPEDMFKVKRTPVDVVLPTGAAVLNAADELVARMAELSAGDVIFFGLDRTLPRIQEHCQSGRKAVVLDQHQVMLCHGNVETPLIDVRSIPCTHGGRVGFQVENVLAAVAAAWHLGLPAPVICEALTSFQGNWVDNPARFSVVESNGKTLIVFDGRNLSALDAVVAGLRDFPAQRRRIVYSAETDRRESDVVEQGVRLGTEFDAVTLCEIDPAPLQVDQSAIPRLQTGLVNASRCQSLQVIPDWEQAVDRAWEQTQPGELLVVQSTSIPATIRKLEQLAGVTGNGTTSVPMLSSPGKELTGAQQPDRHCNC